MPDQPMPRPVVGLARGGRYDEQQLKVAWDDACAGRTAPSGLRDQYAAAIYERNNPGRRWADAHPDDLLAYAGDADAVLAVRDTRIEELTARAEQAERRLDLAHQARRAKEHQLDGIRRALCDTEAMQDNDPYSHADLEDVIRQAAAGDADLKAARADPQEGS
ncbi:hypothetical protein [Streptomyces flavidovirens]